MNDKIKQFVEEAKMKQEEINKAVTSEAATPENKPTDEATASGENKPSIEDAKTADQLKAEQDAAAQAAAEAAPAKPEMTFDHLFAPDLSLGATLKQNPNGGNIMSNMKKPTMDYVERAKNGRNQSMSAEELAQVKYEVKANKK